MAVDSTGKIDGLKELNRPSTSKKSPDLDVGKWQRWVFCSRISLIIDSIIAMYSHELIFESICLRNATEIQFRKQQAVHLCPESIRLQ